MCQRNYLLTCPRGYETECGLKFFAGGDNKFIDDKISKLAKSEDFTQSLVRHLIRSSAFTTPVTRFVKKHAERAVASEAKFRQDISRKIPAKEEVVPPSPLTGCSIELSKTSKDDKKKEENYNFFAYSLNVFFLLKMRLKTIISRLRSRKHEKGSKRVKCFKRLNSNLTTSLDFKNCRL